jgi:hypothetical protein
MELGFAIVLIALYRRISPSEHLEGRIEVLEGSYKQLRAAKANAARSQTKNVSPFQPIHDALSDLTPDERSLFGGN